MPVGPSSHESWVVLGNLSLRPKIALILLLPVAALLLLAGLRIGSSVSTSRQAAQVRRMTEFALHGTALAHELQRERASPSAPCSPAGATRRCSSSGP